MIDSRSSSIACVTASKDTKQNENEGKKSSLGRHTIPLGSGDDLNKQLGGRLGETRKRRERERRKEDEGFLLGNASFPLIPPLSLSFPFTKKALDKMRNKC